MDKLVYRSRWKLGEAYHLVKISPSTTETVCYKIPGGLCVIADKVIENNEGTWLVLNRQTMMQLRVNAQQPIYVCARLDTKALFMKVYGN